MDLINNIDNEITTLWQTITKASSSITSDFHAKVRDNIIGGNNSVQLHPTSIGPEFFPTLSDNIQPLV